MLKRGRRTGGRVVLHEGACVDELEGIRREMGVLCERGADCCQGSVWRREVKGYPGDEGGSVDDEGDDDDDLSFPHFTVTMIVVEHKP